MRRLIALFFAIIVLGSANPANAQSANDFTINSFDATYKLSKDEQNRSKLRITETIQTQFPDRDQNHGIERALPQKYNGHTLRLKINSVKDQSGKNIEWEDSTQNGNKVLRIGDPDTYVRGAQTYVIDYSYQDVVVDNQWRWNTNGLQWQQPFKTLNATVQLEGSLAQSVTDRSCVYGGSSAETPCTITGYTFSAPEALKSNQNLTFQLDFKDGTFVNYQDPPAVAAVKRFQYPLLSLALIASAALVAYSVRVYRKYDFKNKRGVIVPEYLPPKQASLTQSAIVYGKTVGITSTAQILDLAVRHYIKVYELEKTGVINKKSHYKLELTKPVNDLLPDEQAFVVALFGSSEVGATADIQEKNTKLATALQKQFTDTQKQTYASEYYVQGANKKRHYVFLLVVFAVWVAVFAGAIALSDYSTQLSVIGAGIAGLNAFYAFVMVFVVMATKDLSSSGAQLYDYLEGLNMYMNVAEKERLAVLQSPTGSIKTPVDTTDTAQLVKLYERVLPYAVLMGVEKDWAKQMQLYYTQNNSTPDWYTGTGVFHAGVFAASMSDFSSSMNSYSSPSSSSTSSGSGSGGSGGGGGGW